MHYEREKIVKLVLLSFSDDPFISSKTVFTLRCGGGWFIQIYFYRQNKENIGSKSLFDELEI